MSDNTPKPTGPRLVAYDGLAYWLFPDGSHRGVTQSDAAEINRLLDHAQMMHMEIHINGT